MSRPGLEGWATLAADAQFAAPEACSARATRFERTIRRRNGIEYAAGVMVIALFGAGAVAAFAIGEWLLALGPLMVIAGALVLMANLRRRGSNLERRPEDSCAAHLRRQLAHQCAALRSVPVWYIGPLVPGVLVFLGTVAFKVAQQAGWSVALAGMAGPAAAVLGIFAAVIALNLWAASRLDRQISELDNLLRHE
jgi:general stress protein CsbA